MAAAEEDFVLADGARLRVVRAGGSEPSATVLLLHSYAQDHRVWHKVIDVVPAAAERPVAVIAYDHRGHGSSTRAESTAGTMTVPRLADDLAELIEGGTGAQPLVLVGHGMGGLVVMSLAVRHPELFDERVSGMVFLATPVVTDAAATVPRSAGRLARDLHAILGPRIVGRVRRRVDKATSIGLRWLLLGDDPDPGDVHLVAEMVLDHWPDTVARFLPALDHGDWRSELAGAHGTDGLVVVGDRDRMVPVAHAEYLAGVLPDGHLVVLPGCGHMLPLEAVPEIVPRIVGQARHASRR